MIVTILILVVFAFGLGTSAVLIANGAVSKFKRTNQIDAYEAPNQQTINELEAEMGIGRDINGLPDCHWYIKRGCEIHRYGTAEHDGDGLSIYLKDSSNKTLRSLPASSWTLPSFDGQLRQRFYVKRTSEQIDQVVQSRMKELVKDELSARERAAGLNNIIDKYSGKAVE